MDQINDGGNAFPSIDGEGTVFFGMSLRDYFAGQALAGMQTDGFTTPLMPSIAKRAYVIADAMLAERQKERE